MPWFRYERNTNTYSYGCHVQEMTGQPVLFTERNNDYLCHDCGKGLADKGRSHFQYRDKCVGQHLIRAYGYLPFVEQSFATVPLKDLDVIDTTKRQQ